MGLPQPHTAGQNIRLNAMDVFHFLFEAKRGRYRELHGFPIFSGAI
jgi:hypothetical protein